MHELRKQCYLIKNSNKTNEIRVIQKSLLPLLPEPHMGVQFILLSLIVVRGAVCNMTEKNLLC